MNKSEMRAGVIGGGFGSRLCALLSVVALVGVIASPPEAEAQVTTLPNLYLALSNAATPITTSATTNFTNGRPIPIRKGQGAAFTTIMGTTNAGVNTGNVGIGFAVSPDGTNYTTNPQFWVVGPGNSTAASRWSTNVPPLVLDNWAYFKAITGTNVNTNTFYLTNIIVSIK